MGESLADKTSVESSWVDLLTAAIYGSEVIDLATSGYTTFHLLPHKPFTRTDLSLVDTARNITKAIALRPDCIIIVLGSHDLRRGWNNDAIVNNLEELRTQTSIANIDYYITTSLPVAGPEALTEQVLIQKEQILQYYGKQAINLFDHMATPESLPDPELFTTSLTTLNEAGHKRVFSLIWQQVTSR
ncbi:hypothetical protein GCM10023189_35230 [Nibrella saemangeumensis]|uniref:SGNH hydrolase-type esterase domain-containing protein n=1 Tax=Nibrella saemangeumensis TaxID=1084526 RepID=A0ABP8N2S1_9BACT